MIARNRLQLLALGAMFALGAGSAAEARSHSSHEARSSGHQIAYNGRHGAAIAFSERGHERVAFSRNAMYFSTGRHAGRFHFGGGETYTAESGHSGGGIQCVTFARADSGIELAGNASSWWYNAAGVYQRGARPEAGAVLNFRANGAMRMGHVAVVNEVVNSRTIAIDHANWGGPGAVRGGVSRDISVVDVSPGNDWSAVRVALGHTAQYGSIYPTYGFIYNRPDGGTMVASDDHSAPVLALNQAPRDLRGRAVMQPAAASFGFDEVAEAPDSTEPRGSSNHYASRRFASRQSSFRAPYQGLRAARVSTVGTTASRSGRHALLSTTSHHSGHHA